MLPKKQRKAKALVMAGLISIVFTVIAFFVFFLIQGKQLTRSGEFIATGVLRIQSRPSNVEVFINSEPYSKNGNLVQSVPLGTIKLELKKDGYTTWTKNVTVEPGIVKDVFAQLYSKEIVSTVLTELPINQIVYSIDSSYAFFTVLDSKSENQNGIWSIKLSNGFLDFGSSEEPKKLEGLTESLIAEMRDNPYQLILSDDRSRIAIDLPSLQSLYILSTSNNTPILNIKDLISFYPEKFFWLSGSGSFIVQQENLLAEYRLQNQNRNLIYFNVQKPPIFCKSGNSLYVIDETNNKLLKFNNGSSKEVVVDSRVVKINNSTNLHCAENNDDVLVIENPNYITYFNVARQLYSLISQNAVIKNVSPNGLTVIFTEENNKFTFNIEEKLKDNDLDVSLNRFSIEPNEFTTLANNNIITIEKLEKNLSNIYISDKDGKNKHLLLKKLEVDPSSIRLSSNNSELYIVAGANKNLQKITLD